MIKGIVKEECIKRCTKCYLKFLSDVIYKDEEFVNSLYLDEDTAKAQEDLVREYFNAIEEFGKTYPKGKYFDEIEYVAKSPKLKTAIHNFVTISNDKKFVKYLQVYSYMVQELSGILYSSDYKQNPKTLNNFFNRAERNAIEMLGRVEKDIAEGNYWWLNNSATTLRRQLSDNFAFVNTKRFKYMCEKYMGRKMSDEDIKKELTETVNGGEKLIQELDANMAKVYNAVPYYRYVDYSGGVKKIDISEEAPTNGIYYYIVYHTPISSKQNTNEGKFY